MRIFVGGIVAGAVLFAFAGTNPIYGVIAGWLAASLMLQLGPRSMAEKTGAGLTAALIAWAAGPGSGAGPGLVRFMLGWLAASCVLAYCVHPRAE